MRKFNGEDRKKWEEIHADLPFVLKLTEEFANGRKK